ncbi:signal peptidase I [archaeon]|nr:signal peptidase I [archaeon]
MTSKFITKDEKQILLYIIIIITGLFVINNITENYLNTDKFLVTVLSESMKPTLYRGDIVIIKNEINYNEKDIIVFNTNNNIYIHRIIATKEQKIYRTAGDKTKIPDQWTIKNENILGKVIFKIPKLGHINLWLAGK